LVRWSLFLTVSVSDYIPFVKWFDNEFLKKVWRSYLVHLEDSGLSAASVRDAARIVKTWLRFLYLDGELPTDITNRLTLPQSDEKLLPAFTAEDVQTLLRYTRNKRDTAIVYVLLDTGVRVSELCALNTADFDIRNGAITVRMGKGRKDRVTYIGAKAKRALLKYLGAQPAIPSGPLFTTSAGERYTVDGIQSMLHRLGIRAKVAHCHPHTFRRTFALWSLRAGMNIYALQRLMGHADLTMLRRYLALVETDLATAHREHGAVDTLL